MQRRLVDAMMSIDPKTKEDMRPTWTHPWASVPAWWAIGQ
jgi:hypothetical protein